MSADRLHVDGPLKRANSARGETTRGPSQRGASMRRTLSDTLDDAWLSDRPVSAPTTPRRQMSPGFPLSRAASSQSISEDYVTQVHSKTFGNVVKCIAFTAGGGSIAAGAADGTLIMYSANDAVKIIHTFVGHTDACVSADFTVGGSKLVSGSWDGTVRLWETTSGELSNTLVGHDGKVTSVAFSDSGEWLVSGGMDETVRIWATATGDLIDVLAEGVVHPITSVALSRGGDYLAEASNDFTVRVWGIKQDGSRTQRVLSRIRDDARRLSEAEFESRESQRGRRASRSLRSSLRRSFFGQDATSSTPTKENQPDRSDSVIGSLNTTHTLSGHSATVSDIAFHPAKPILFTVSHDATVRMYSTESGGSLGSFCSDCGKAIWACRFSADGSILAIGTGDGIVEVWGSRSPEAISLLFSFKAHESFVDTLAFSGDGLRLATGSGSDVLLWKLKPADWYTAREQQRVLRPTGDTLSADSSEASRGLGRSTIDPSVQDVFASSDIDGVSSADMSELLKQQRSALAEEENIVNALHIAVQKRQEDIDALGSRAASLAAKGNRRTDMQLPSWGLVTEDTQYLEKLRARKRVLYERVGRAEVKGNTATMLDVAQLHPHDLERLARFEELRQLGGSTTGPRPYA